MAFRSSVEYATQGAGPAELNHRPAAEPKKGSLPIEPADHVRMRQRFIERGESAMADDELLEILMSFAEPKKDSRKLANALLDRFESLGSILAAPARDLVITLGVCPNIVAVIKLVHASATRLGRNEIIDRPMLNDLEPLVRYLNIVMGRHKIEHVRVLFLDNRNCLIIDEVHCWGTVNHTSVYPREILRRALEINATALIVAHNHPSGDPAPSAEDIAITYELREAAKVLSIVLHDHIIIGSRGWISFRKERLL